MNQAYATAMAVEGEKDNGSDTKSSCQRASDTEFLHCRLKSRLLHAKLAAVLTGS